MIEMDKAISVIDPAMAKTCRAQSIQKKYDLLKEHYEGLLRHDNQHQSLRIMKTQLRAYLMCKGTDKNKAREAIDSFKTLAQEEFATVMNGNVRMMFLNRNGVSYYGDKDDENARKAGEARKNTIDALEFFCERM